MARARQLSLCFIASVAPCGQAKTSMDLDDHSFAAAVAAPRRSMAAPMTSGAMFATPRRLSRRRGGFRTARFDIARSFGLEIAALGRRPELREALVIGVGSLDLLAIVDRRLRKSRRIDEEGHLSDDKDAEQKLQSFTLLKPRRSSC